MTPASPSAPRPLAWIGAGLLIVPLVELFVGIQIARWIGTGNAVVLLLLGCVAGAWVLRRAGMVALRTLAASTQAHPGAARNPPNTGGLAAAGVLLLFPGFVTDVLGLALLVPPVRRLASRITGRAVARRLGGAARGTRIVTGDVVEVKVVEVTDIGPAQGAQAKGAQAHEIEGNPGGEPPGEDQR